MIVEIKHKSHVQRMTYQDFEERIRCGEVDPKTQIRFEVVTGDAFVPVEQLELYHALADPRRMAFRKKLTRPGIPIVTALLVGVQIRIYLASALGGQEDWLKQAFFNWSPGIVEQGQVYRLISYGLLHTSFTHLLFNLYFLAYTAYHLERAMGRANLLLLFFGSVFTGGLLSMMMAPDRPSLGSSCGVYGLLAAVVILGWKHWENLPPQSRKYFGWALAPYLGFSLLSGLSADNIDNWGHLGGLLGGAVLMTSLDPEVVPDQQEINARTRQVVLAMLLLTTVGITVSGTRLLPLRPHADEYGWSIERPQFWGEGWAFTGDRGWFSPTSWANVSVSTIVHPRPISLQEAANMLENRVASGSKNLERVTWEQVSIAGGEAVRMVLRFELSGEPQELTTMLLVRGVYEHRVQFQALTAAVRNYTPLVERILDSVALEEPQDLLEARRRAAFHPRSWDPALALGDALYRIGSPQEALESYNRALSIDPVNPKPILGLLRVYADYEIVGGLEIARGALVTHGDVLDVVEAAADVIAMEGHRQEAVMALDSAWAKQPDNPVLRRIRLQWGLSVQPPTPQDDMDTP